MSYTHAKVQVQESKKWMDRGNYIIFAHLVGKNLEIDVIFIMFCLCERFVQLEDMLVIELISCMQCI